MAKKRGAGDGALYKRKDGMWEGRVDVPSGPDGRRRTRSVYAKSRAVCAEKLRKLQAEVDSGLVATGPATTVGEWLPYWLANIHRSKVKPGTRADYARVIKNDIVPRLGTKKLTQLQPEDVLAMEQSVAKRSTRTAQLAHHVLNRAVADAIRWKRCSFNPVAVVPTPTHTKAEREPFSRDEVQRILTAATEIDTGGTGPLLASRWVAAFLTGARKSELLGLTWDRVDLENMTLDLAWQLQQLPQKHGCGDQADGTWPCGRVKAAYCPDRQFDLDPGDDVKLCHRGVGWIRPKTTAGKRVVPITPRLASILQEHWQATADRPNPHNLVWCHRDGRPIYHKDDHEAWQALLIASGVRQADGPTIDQHRTRNTALTMLLDAGVDPHIVNATVGHSDVAMTRGYQYVDLSMARRAFQNLDSLAPGGGFPAP